MFESLIGTSFEPPLSAEADISDESAVIGPAIDGEVQAAPPMKPPPPAATAALTVSHCSARHESLDGRSVGCSRRHSPAAALSWIAAAAAGSQHRSAELLLPITLFANPSPPMSMHE